MIKLRDSLVNFRNVYDAATVDNGGRYTLMWHTLYDLRSVVDAAINYIDDGTCWNPHPLYEVLRKGPHSRSTTNLETIPIADRIKLLSALSKVYDAVINYLDTDDSYTRDLKMLNSVVQDAKEGEARLLCSVFRSRTLLGLGEWVVVIDRLSVNLSLIDEVFTYSVSTW